MPLVTDKEFVKTSQIDRNCQIWIKWKNEGKPVKQIMEEIGCSESVVRHVIKKLEVIENYGSVDEYFEMAFDISDMLENAGVDPNLHITNIMMTLWSNEIVSRNKFKRMNVGDFDDLINSKRLKRAGFKAIGVLKDYRYHLKHIKTSK